MYEFFINGDALFLIFFIFVNYAIYLFIKTK